MDRGAHQRDADDLAAHQQIRHLLRRHIRQACRQPHVPGVRRLRLQPHQVLDGRHDRLPLPCEQPLPRQRGAVELTPGQYRHQAPHSKIVTDYGLTVVVKSINF
jgi:hypothetical protein